MCYVCVNMCYISHAPESTENFGKGRVCPLSIFCRILIEPDISYYYELIIEVISL
jgi:hypothetical protein